MKSSVPTQSGDIVKFVARHLDEALKLSQALDWPYRAEDWAFAVDLGRGFAYEDNGELLGTAMWWPYGSDWASTGMIIVADHAQRRGIGARLMTALLDDAGSRSIILNSTQEGNKLYARLGFEPYDMVHQHQAVLDAAPQVDHTVMSRAATSADRQAVLGIDRSASGMDRTVMLDALGAVGEVMVAEREGGLVGYACLRRWGRGYVIGPVVAQDIVEAKALIAELASREVGAFVRIDVPASCRLSDWLKSIGLPKVGEVVSMSLGEPPQSEIGTNLYALANQSFG